MFDEEKRKNDQIDNEELTESQKEEIKKGNYDPWDFEEDEIDEDSYYSEDDKE